jgi:hypothetical protein
MNTPHDLNWRPQTDSITLRLDRAASILRNTSNTDGSFELTLTDADCCELSLLLTQAANEIATVQADLDQL